MTALDKCPLLGFFATASEDGYIKVRIFYLLKMTLFYQQSFHSLHCNFEQLIYFKSGYLHLGEIYTA